LLFSIYRKFKLVNIYVLSSAAYVIQKIPVQININANSQDILGNWIAFFTKMLYF